ncbi:hypothetical protein KI387_035009, partial [Taxus chinensis]
MGPPPRGPIRTQGGPRAQSEGARQQRPQQTTADHQDPCHRLLGHLLEVLLIREDLEDVLVVELLDTFGEISHRTLTTR